MLEKDTLHFINKKQTKHTFFTTTIRKEILDINTQKIKKKTVEMHNGFFFLFNDTPTHAHKINVK